MYSFIGYTLELPVCTYSPLELAPLPQTQSRRLWSTGVFAAFFRLGVME